MGQYHIIVNVNKCQYLNPHKLGDGLKLLEFGCSGCGTMTALALLLADSNGRGGGDLNVKNDPYKLVGSWAGDAIVITGDYGDPGKLYRTAPEDDKPTDERGNELNLYSYAQAAFCDISKPIKEVMSADRYIAESLGKNWGDDESFDPAHRYAPKGPQGELPLAEVAPTPKPVTPGHCPPAPPPVDDDPLAGF